MSFTRPIVRSQPGVHRLAFTLVELLVVIGIITVLVAIAVPSFRALTGGRSTEAAANNLAAAISQARAQAIATQKVHGVLFAFDPAADRVRALIVEEVPQPAAPEDPDAVYVDATGDSVLLPQGIGVQTLVNGDMNTATTPPTRRSDGYIGANPLFIRNVPYPATKVGGALLFDSGGKLLTRQYRLRVLDRSDPASAIPSRLLKIVRGDEGDNDRPGAEEGTASYGTSAQGSVGVVVYDLEAYRSISDQSWTDKDYDRADGKPTAANYASSGDSARETWLDDNAVPYIISRHGGALLRNR